MIEDFVASKDLAREAVAAGFSWDREDHEGLMRYIGFITMNSVTTLARRASVQGRKEVTIGEGRHFSMPMLLILSEDSQFPAETGIRNGLYHEFHKYVLRNNRQNHFFGTLVADGERVVMRDIPIDYSQPYSGGGKIVGEIRETGGAW